MKAVITKRDGSVYVFGATNSVKYSAETDQLDIVYTVANEKSPPTIMSITFTCGDWKTAQLDATAPLSYSVLSGAVKLWLAMQYKALTSL